MNSVLRSRLCVLAIASLGAGSPVFAGFKCPAKGGAPWREYRSAHFDIFTDADDSKVVRLVDKLESMHVLELQAIVGEQVEIPGKLRVIAFDSHGVFKDLAGRYEIAGYYKQSIYGDPIIVLPIVAVDESPEDVAHEVAHHLTSFLFIRQPAWFSEGLAEFLQTVAMTQDRIEPGLGSHIVHGGRDHSASVGAVPGQMAAAVQEWPKVSFAELWDWDGGKERAGASYHLYGWLLYHWLWNTRSKELSAFQQRLTNGDDPREAWRAAFPDLDPAKPDAAAKVDDALYRYRQSGRYVSYRVKAVADTSFKQAGKIASADVHMLLHDATNAWSKEETIANLEEALREDPNQPEAIVVQARLDKSSPVERLRKSVGARPNDWRGWLSLAQALPDDAKPEKENAFRKAVALNADNSQGQNGLAWLLVTQGRAKEALPIANRALDLAPGNPAIIDTLAMVAASLGKCNEALVLERRAVSMVPAKSEMELGFRKRITQFESECGKAVPAAATTTTSPR